MELKVVIDKKFAFMIFGAILILAGAIYVNAQNPAVFGHDWSEIENRPAGLDDGDDYEADTDIQELSINGNTLSLQRGGSVILPSGGNSPIAIGSLEGGDSFGSIADNQNYCLTSNGMGTSCTVDGAWSGKTVLINMVVRTYAHQGTPARHAIYYRESSDTSVPSWGNKKGSIETRADGDGLSYDETSISMVVAVPESGSVWFKLDELAGSHTGNNPLIAQYNWIAFG